MKTLKQRKGFTLIELLIVVVIIGILAAIAIPNFISMVTRAKDASVKSNMHTAQVSVEDFNTQTEGSYPVDFSILVNAVRQELGLPLVDANANASVGGIKDGNPAPPPAIILLPGNMRNPVKSSATNVAFNSGAQMVDDDNDGAFDEAWADANAGNIRYGSYDIDASGNLIAPASTNGAMTYRIGGHGAKSNIAMVLSAGE